MRGVALAVLALFSAAAPAAAQENAAQEAARRRAALATLGPEHARRIFHENATPAPLAARAIGAYGRGCLAGAVALSPEGPGWQTMRPSRNRAWGHPSLIRWIERFARDARAEGWPGLLVGDISQARGGPMLTGHASHQLGIEADIWLTPMGRRLGQHEREEMSAVDMVRPDLLSVYPDRFTDAHVRLLRRAASYPEIDRIFVNAAIKRALCERAPPGDRSWLSRIRAWNGHTYHFHVALRCPAGSPECSSRRAPPPPGDGCGAELQQWFREEVRFPRPRPPVTYRQWTMADLPAACRQVVIAR
jgi:penicillin-insensitive murein endopeptidase